MVFVSRYQHLLRLRGKVCLVLQPKPPPDHIEVDGE